MQGTNRLLEALPEAERALLMQDKVILALPRRTMLFEPQVKPPYGYLLTSGMASVVTQMEDGVSAEVSILGYEGLVGGIHLLGPSCVPTTCFMQLDGAGYRVPMSRLQHLFDTNEVVRERVLQSVQEQANMVSQIAGCNRLHEAEERLARWLLMAQDRTGNEVLNLTQEFMADLLGARRTTVTVVAGALQRSGLIEYHRGSVRILDREKLEATACSCYAIVRSLHEKLYQ